MKKFVFHFVTNNEVTLVIEAYGVESYFNVLIYRLSV